MIEYKCPVGKQRPRDQSRRPQHREVPSPYHGQHRAIPIGGPYFL